MDHERHDGLRYVNITEEMGESIANTSEKMYDLAMSEAHKALSSNTPVDRAYVWAICTCAATLARCLMQDQTAAGTNLKLAEEYIKRILHKVM
jgi:hypothetical protein